MTIDSLYSKKIGGSWKRDIKLEREYWLKYDQGMSMQEFADWHTADGDGIYFYKVKEIPRVLKGVNVAKKYVAKKRVSKRRKKSSIKSKQVSTKKSSKKNVWVRNKRMSEVTKAPTFVNQTKGAKYIIKVTSKKRIAYFLTTEDWNYNKNYKIFNR